MTLLDVIRAAAGSQGDDDLDQQPKPKPAASASPMADLDALLATMKPAKGAQAASDPMHDLDSLLTTIKPPTRTTAPARPATTSPTSPRLATAPAPELMGAPAETGDMSDLLGPNSLGARMRAGRAEESATGEETATGPIPGLTHQVPTPSLMDRLMGATGHETAPSVPIVPAKGLAAYIPPKRAQTSPVKPVEPNLNGSDDLAPVLGPQSLGARMQQGMLAAHVAPKEPVSLAEGLLTGVGKDLPVTPPTSLAGRAAYVAGSMAAHPIQTAEGFAKALPEAGGKLGEFAAQELRKTQGDWTGADAVSAHDAGWAAGQLLVSGLAEFATPAIDVLLGKGMGEAAAKAVQAGKSATPALVAGYTARVVAHAGVGAGVGAVFSPDDPAAGAFLGGMFGAAHAAPQLPWTATPKGVGADLASVPERLLSDHTQAPVTATGSLVGTAAPPAEPDFEVQHNTAAEALADVASRRPAPVLSSRAPVAPAPVETPTAEPAAAAPATNGNEPAAAPATNGPLATIAKAIQNTRDAQATLAQIGQHDERRALDDAVRAAHVDELTGLGNRRAWNKAKARAEEDPNTAVLSIDVNGLKDVNDGAGHAAGDDAIKHVAAVAQRRLGGRNSFRNGGDELNGLASWDKAQEAADAIKKDVGVVELQTPRGPVRYSVSIGIGNTADEADAAMYKQKAIDKKAQGIPDRRKATPVSAPAIEAQKGVSAAREVPLADLDVEPERFQFKQNTNERGVTNALAGVKFNPDLAGVVTVWRDPADGRLKVVNGHHRVDLAQQHGVKKLLVREIDAPNAATARARGALINIAEDKGTPVDVAKFLRDTHSTAADLATYGVNSKNALARKGVALSQLHPALFHQVATGHMPVERGVVIGEGGLEPEQQLALTNMLKQREGNGKRLTNEALGELIRFVKGAGTEDLTQESLFGTEQLTHSLAIEKAELSAYVKDHLAKDRRLFGFVSKSERANRLATSGVGMIETGRAADLATRAAQAEEVYNRLSTMSGPVSGALTEAARQLAQGGDKHAIRQSLYEAVAGAVGESLRALGGGEAGGVHGLPQGRGGVGAAAERAGNPAAAGEPGEPGAEPPFNDPNQVGFGLAENRPARYGQRAPTLEEAEKALQAAEHAFFSYTSSFSPDASSTAPLDTPTGRRLLHAVAQARVLRDRLREESGPASMMKTGEGTVGAGFDPSLFKKLGANLYKGGLAEIAVKEGLQNAVDALRAAPPGHEGRVRIHLNPLGREVTIADNGVGMSPEVAANQFMDIGGSFKSEGSSGGYGLAKVGLLASAEHFRMVTVAAAPAARGGFLRGKPAAPGNVRTIIEGSGSDWADGKLRIHSEPTDAPTGTALNIRFEAGPDINWHAATEFLRRASHYGRLPFQLDATAQDYYDKPEVIAPVDQTFHGRMYGIEAMRPDPVETLSVPGARAVIYQSEESEPMYGSATVSVLNNGLYQFETPLQVGEKGPRRLVVDVQPSANVDTPNYPFTTSREALKGPIEEALRKFGAEVALRAGREEMAQMTRALADAPIIPGVEGARVVDTGAQVPREVLERLAARPYAQTLAQLSRVALEEITARLRLGRAIATPQAGGLSAAKGYLGVNIHADALHAEAKRLDITLPLGPENVIYYNPWVTAQEMLATKPRASAESTRPAPADAQVFADKWWETLAHEVVHQIERGHGVGFAGAITRAMSTLGRIQAPFLEQAEHVFNAMLADESGFDEDLHELLSHWGKGNDLFGRFSDQHAGRGGADAGGGALGHALPHGDAAGPHAAGRPRVDRSGAAGGHAGGEAVGGGAGAGGEERDLGAVAGGASVHGESDGLTVRERQAAWGRKLAASKEQLDLFGIRGPDESVAHTPAQRAVMKRVVEKIREIGLPEAGERRQQLEDAARMGLIDPVGRVLRSPKDIAELMTAFRHPSMEILHAFLLDGNSKVVGHIMRTSGSLNWAAIPAQWPAEIAALARGTGGKVVAFGHNHPSGDPTRSLPDASATETLEKELEPFGLTVAGHVIINHDKATWFTTLKNGATVESIPIAPSKGRPAPWRTAIEASAPQLSTPTRVVEYLSGATDPEAATVLFLDAQHRVVAVRPYLLSAMEAMPTWMTDALTAHGAQNAVIAVPRAHANDLARRVGAAQNIHGEGHEWAHPILDVIGMEHDSRGNPAGYRSYAEMGALQSRDLEPPHDFQFHTIRLRPGESASAQVQRALAAEGGPAQGGRRPGANGTGGISALGRVGERDLFGNESESEPGQGSLFSSREGSESARSLRETERAARAEIAKLQQELSILDGKDKYGRRAASVERLRQERKRAEIAKRMAELERLVNRDKAISPDEIRRRLAAGEDGLFGGGGSVREPQPEQTRTPETVRALASAHPKLADLLNEVANYMQHDGTGWAEALDSVAEDDAARDTAHSVAQLDEARQILEGEKEPRLSGLHNLTPENLIAADAMGGFPAPSLAVVPEHQPFSQYGNITLIAKSSAFDPAKVPVFDADAYTGRAPRPEYRPRPWKEVHALLAPLRPILEATGDAGLDASIENDLGHGRPDEAEQRLVRSVGGKVAFLKSRGVEIPLAKKAAPIRHDIAKAPALREFFRTHGVERQAAPGSPYWALLSRAALEAVNASGTDAERNALSAGLFSEDGVLGHGAGFRLMEDQAKIGKRIPDAARIRARAEKAVAPLQAEFETWAHGLLAPFRRNPYVAIGRRKVPHTLESTTEAAVRARGVAGAEKTMTFGPGNARAATSTRFRNIEHARNAAREQIQTPDEVKARVAALGDEQNQWRDHLLEFWPHRGFGGTWDGLDAMHRGLAAYLKKSPVPKAQLASMRAALAGAGFRNVSRAVLEESVAMASHIRNMPVDYFEAKPQRAVGFDEMAGAVIPKDAPAKVREILERRGIPYREYEGEHGRQQVTQTFRRELHAGGADVLREPTPRYGASGEMPPRESPALPAVQTQDGAVHVGTTYLNAIDAAHRAGSLGQFERETFLRLAELHGINQHSFPAAIPKVQDVRLETGDVGGPLHSLTMQQLADLSKHFSRELEEEHENPTGDGDAHLQALARDAARVRQERIRRAKMEMFKTGDAYHRLGHVTTHGRFVPRVAMPQEFPAATFAHEPTPPRYGNTPAESRESPAMPAIQASHGKTVHVGTTYLNAVDNALRAGAITPQDKKNFLRHVELHGETIPQFQADRPPQLNARLETGPLEGHRPNDLSADDLRTAARVYQQEIEHRTALRDEMHTRPEQLLHPDDHPESPIAAHHAELARTESELEAHRRDQTRLQDERTRRAVESLGPAEWGNHQLGHVTTHGRFIPRALMPRHFPDAGFAHEPPPPAYGGGAQQPPKPPAAAAHPMPEPAGFDEGRKLSPLDLVRKIRAVFNPESLGPEARATAGTIRHQAAERFRRFAQAESALRRLQKHIDKQPRAQQVHLWDAYERGVPTGDPYVDRANKVFRDVTEQRTKTLISLDRLKAQRAIENYIGRFWSTKTPGTSVASVLRTMFAKRPYEGPKSFLKHRSVEQFTDGLDMGLVPATYNYVESQLAKIAEMERLIEAEHILRTEQQAGRARPVMLGQDPPVDLEGRPWVRIDREGNDPAFTMYAPPEVSHWEGVDRMVFDRLSLLLADLGISHSRKPNIGGQRLGYAEKSGEKITTRFGGPEGVIMHELGHALDAQYGLQKAIEDGIGRAPTRTAQSGKNAGKQVPDYKNEESTERARRKQLREELRNLANLRRESLSPSGQSEVPESQDLNDSDRQYLHSWPEKMANMVEAYISARDRFQQVAPGIFSIFDGIIAKHPELHPLRDIRPSLSRDEHQQTTRLPGPVLVGHWFAPANSAAVWQNYLSRGLRGNPIYQAFTAPGAAATSMLLGLSGFHGTVIATEGMFSDMALAMEHVGSGEPAGAARAVGRASASPVVGVAFGRKVMQEYRVPGSHPELAKVLQAMIEGGFRGQEKSELWHGDRTKALKKALNDALHGDTALRQAWGASRVPLDALYAGIEAAAYPLMGKYVPLMKTAATYQAVAKRLSELPPNLPPERLHDEMWDIVKEMDFRFGHVVYDNHFINNVAKHLAQAMFMAPGWTFGTATLMARGAKDVARVPKRAYDRARGKPGADEQPILGRSAKYWIAAVAGTMLINGIVTYLNTGQEPGQGDDGWKDFFAFRDGTFDIDGNPNRHTIPGYVMHDAHDWPTHPGKTFLNKLSPFWAFAARAANNRTYFGDMVRDPEAPLATQAGQVATEAGKEFLPLSAQNYLEGRKRDETNVSEMARNAIGVTPAKREFTRTPAQNKMAEYLARRGRTAQTPEEAATRQRLGAVLQGLRGQGDVSNAIMDAIEHGDLTEPAFNRMMKRAGILPLQERYKTLTLPQAIDVFSGASPWERGVFAEILEQKIDRASRSP